MFQKSSDPFIRDLSINKIEQSLQKSLKSLNSTWLDILYLHEPQLNEIENLDAYTRDETASLWWHHDYVEECIDIGIAFMMDFENYYYDHEDDEYHFDYDSASTDSGN